MDITEGLRQAENSLRDFIEETLTKKNGNDWVHNSGIDEATIKKWEKAKRSEQYKQSHGVVESRLIYYADFSDLHPILTANWATSFHEVFDVNESTMTVWLEALRLVRNQEAHGREILEHQRHSALGAAGEIRTRLIRHRSKRQSAQDYFPQIERVSDDIGNIWTVNEPKKIITGCVLRCDDILTFTITAQDPDGTPLEYSVVPPVSPGISWGKGNIVQIQLNELAIGREREFCIYVRHIGKKYHAVGVYFDDMVKFEYDVLP